MEGGLGSGRNRDAEKPSSSAHHRRCPSSLHPRIRRVRCPMADDDGDDGGGRRGWEAAVIAGGGGGRRRRVSRSGVLFA